MSCIRTTSTALISYYMYKQQPQSSFTASVLAGTSDTAMDVIVSICVWVKAAMSVAGIPPKTTVICMLR